MTSTETPVIELDNVALAFGDHAVLRKVDLKVQAGKCLVLVGPSGQGKTSLLKLIAGLVSPSSGRVLLNGVDIHKLPPSESRKIFLQLGMLFQKNALFDSMTALENILFPLREVTSLNEQERLDLALELLEAVDLKQAQNLHPHEISGGMQKRLGIARALALKPKIILYDDPTAGLDPITSRKIAALLKNLNEAEQVTTVVITNDMMRAFQLADDIGFVWDQTVQLVGSADDARTTDQEPFCSFLKGRNFA